MSRLAIALAGLLTVGCGGAPTPETETTTVTAAEGGDEAEAEAPVRPLSEEEAAEAQAQAMQTQVRAQEAQTRCDEDAERAACEEAEHLFHLAADTWRALVLGRPGDVAGTDWAFMHARALFRAGSYAAAAESAARYLDDGDEQWRRQAAQTLVAARERALEAEMVAVREHAPFAQGDPPEVVPIDIPAPVQGLHDARARFLEIVTDEADEDDVRRGYALANAILLFRYGHWEQARPSLRDVFVAGCAGEHAWIGAGAAWAALREMALVLERYDTVRQLGEQLGSDGCDFGDATPPSCGTDRDHPLCLARADSASVQLLGGRRFMQRAELARGEERRRWARRAAQDYLAALQHEGEVTPRGRVTALVEARRAFRIANDVERAAAVDRRIVREVEPRRMPAGERAFAVVTVASALDRLLLAAAEAEEREAVVRLAERLTSRDFDLPELAEERARARGVLPGALAALGRHDEAARAYSDLAEGIEDPTARRDASLASALQLVEAGNCRRATRPLRAFADAHGEDEAARDDVIRALWNVAECQRAGSRARATALEAVAEAGVAAGRGISAESRSFAAEAMYRLVDRDLAHLDRLRIRLPRVDDVEGVAPALRDQLRDPTARVREVVQAYARVEQLGDGEWTAAARFKSGQALEALERAVLAASWQIPNDLQRQRRALNAEAFEQLRGIVESRIREILDTQAGAIRCRAANHYRRSVSAAGSAHVDSEDARSARERLAALQLPASCRRRR